MLCHIIARGHAAHGNRKCPPAGHGHADRVVAVKILYLAVKPPQSLGKRGLEYPASAA